MCNIQHTNIQQGMLFQGLQMLMQKHVILKCYNGVFIIRPVVKQLILHTVPQFLGQYRRNLVFQILMNTEKNSSDQNSTCPERFYFENGFIIITLNAISVTAKLRYFTYILIKLYFHNTNGSHQQQGLLWSRTKSWVLQPEFLKY